MRSRLMPRIRLFLRGRRHAARRVGRVRIRRDERLGPRAGDAMVDALLRLRETVDQERLGALPLAWFRVDEAKACAVWYEAGADPGIPAVLPEEQALAERLFEQTVGLPPTPANLLDPPRDPLPMVRYRLLVSRLPAWVARGGRRAHEAVRVGFELMARSPDVLSPYGRWLLAQAVCRAAHDEEELARQTERFRAVTADYRSADGTSMAFCSGGAFDLPLPISLSSVLDLPGIPTDLAALKRDAPPEIMRLIVNLTPRGEQVFKRAFRSRQEAYRHGYPWRKPLGSASEGFVLVRTRVHVQAFFIDRRPVTHACFQDFVHAHRMWLPSRANRHAVDRDTYLPTWHGDLAPLGSASEAITGVTYQACRAYVAACGKQLPTEAQWVFALVGPEVPETRYTGGEGRPTMSEEERANYGRRAAERGLHLLLPERLFDCDGPYRFVPHDGGRVLWDRRGPGLGGGHLWRTPTARGRLPDRAGDANLTFRGVIPASRIWARTLGDAADSLPVVDNRDAGGVPAE